MWSTRLVIGFLLVIFSSQGFTKPTMVLTLHDAVLLGLRFNPEFRTAQLQRVIDKYQLMLAENEFEPQFALGGNYSYTRNVRDNVSTISRNYNLEAAVSLKNKYGTVFSVENTNPIIQKYYSPTLRFKIEQPLLRGFGPRTVEASLLNAMDVERQQKLVYKQAAINTINIITADYFAVVRAKQALTIDQDTLRSYQESIESSKVKLKEGLIPQIDIIQAESRYASQQSVVQNDQNVVSQAELSLLTDIGLNPDTKIIISQQVNFAQVIDKLLRKAGVKSTTAYFQEALLKNITYLTEKINLAILKRDVITTHDNTRWSLDLSSAVQLGDGAGDPDTAGFHNFATGKTHSTSLNLDLTVPVHDIAAQKEYVDAKIALQQAEVLFGNRKRLLNISVLNQLNDIQNQKRLILLTENSLKTQKRLVAMMREKYNIGRISAFEFNENKDRLNQEEQQLIAAKINYILAIQALNDLLGVTLEVWNINTIDVQGKNYENT